ncbi:FAD dependent oxidoreductase domain-containing protein [Sarocladium implicatum]|nr:FAD dependent oxidoreductase domain-containing protein [Sarocladium implicatum]
MDEYDVAVVGLGVLGSAAAFHASLKGVKVLGLEQYDFGNVHGSSHDTSRIVRTSYGAPEYVALARAAYKDWAHLEETSGMKMLTITGGVVFFPRTVTQDTTHEEAGSFAESMTAKEFVRSLKENNIPHEVLSPSEANKRWPQFNIPEDVDTVYTADSGIVHANRSVSAMQHQARAHGAVLKENTQVNRLIPNAKGVVLETSRGSFQAKKVILTPDAWANSLLKPLGADIPLVVMQEQVTYFKPERIQPYEPEKFPVWIWAGTKYYYGFPTYGEPTIKVGQDMACNYMKPEERTFEPSPEILKNVETLTNDLIPGKGKALRTVTCQYAITPDRQFIISPLTDHKDIILGLGSGHAFKFAPAIGRVLAELAVDGETKEDISKFGIPRRAQASKL